MKKLINFLLGAVFAVCLFFLTMQGFAAPTLPAFADLLLRFAAALCIQLLMLRIGKTLWLRILPLALTSLLAVWGFFLLLTSPSWIHATVWGFLADYVSPAIGCIAAAGIHRKRS